MPKIEFDGEKKRYSIQISISNDCAPTEAYCLNFRVSTTDAHELHTKHHNDLAKNKRH